MANGELMTLRREMFDKMEKHLWEDKRPEDSVFYYHPSEDRIVLSHALFWVMTSTIKGKVSRQKHLLLLRQYQEEMGNGVNDKVARRLAATFIVAGGYGGDMKEELADEILDDMDFENNRVKCRKIEEGSNIKSI